MIISRYIGKTLLATTLAITLVLLIVIMSGRVVDYLADAAAGNLPPELLGYLLLYKLPGFLQLILPLGFFIAVMLTYGQLYVDSEIVVLQACGFSQWRLLLTSWMPTTLVVLAVAYLSFVVSPAGEAKLKAEMDRPSSAIGLSTLVAGKFQYLDKGMTIYVRELNDTKTVMHDVFYMQELEQDQELFNVIAVAKSAELRTNDAGVRYLVLLNGRQYRMSVGSLARTQTEFGEFAIKLAVSKADVIRPAPVDALPTSVLLQQGSAETLAALHWRIASPIMVLIAAIIGFSLSKTSHRKGRYGKLLPGIILFFVYFTAVSLLRGAIEDGDLSAAIGLWPLHIVMLAVAFALLWGGHWYQLLRASVSGASRS